MHQRGWRQLPNYSLWASIAGAIKVSLCFCCCCCLRIGGRGRRAMVGSMNGKGSSGGDAGNGLMREEEGMGGFSRQD